MESKAWLLALFTLSAWFTATIQAEEVDLPIGRIVYLGTHEVKLPLTGETIKAAYFRLENLSALPWEFSRRGNEADVQILNRVDDKWGMASWNWCGNGSQSTQLPPGGSFTWIVDPAYYAGKYGTSLRFQLFVSQGSSGQKVTHTSAKDSPPRPRDPFVEASSGESNVKLIRSEPFEFPAVNKAPEKEFSGALQREGRRYWDQKIVTEKALETKYSPAPSIRRRHFRTR